MEDDDDAADCTAGMRVWLGCCCGESELPDSSSEESKESRFAARESTRNGRAGACLRVAGCTGLQGHEMKTQRRQQRGEQQIVTQEIRKN